MKLVGSSKALRSPEFHKKKQVERRVKLTLLSLLAVVVVIAPVLVLRSERLRVASIQVSGNDVTANESIQSAASAHLAGSYLWLIPKASSLLVDKDEIERSLLQTMPRLSSAEASLEGSQILSIAVTEREPFALYCADIADPERPSKCFFLDETGYIFSEAPDFSGGVYRVYSSHPVLPEPVRSQYLEAEAFKKADSFVERLPKLGLEPKAFKIEEGEHQLILAGGTLMKWRAEQDLARLALDLESFLNGLKVKAERYQDLLYIDLRFENKVFYKFRE